MYNGISPQKAVDTQGLVSGSAPGLGTQTKDYGLISLGLPGVPFSWGLPTNSPE